jgi:phosphomevalonate kinase
MKSVETSAPGKLILLGEYAVLFGAPAMVAAVERRAVVTLDPAPSNRYELTAPGLADGSAVFELAAEGALEWCDETYGRRHFGLVERILAGLARTRNTVFDELPPFVATLDTRAFFGWREGEPSKLGLGSSAALTVAFASALEAWAGVDEDSDSSAGRLQALVDLHRHVQGGAGSGVDVAASLIGGIVRYRLGEDRTVAEAASMSLPEDLCMVFVWSGRSASTGGFLERLGIGLDHRPQEVEPVLDELGSVSTDGVAAVSAGNSVAFLEAVDAFWRALDDLGRAISMPILADEHRALRSLAESCSVHYKPSGAGGGDLGVGFTTDETAALKMAERAAFEGYQVLDLHVSPVGLVQPS